EEFAVRSEPEPVAVVAEGFAHRSDYSEFAPPIGELPDRGCFSVASSRGEYRVSGSNRFKDLMSSHHLVLVPDVEPVEGHELDEPDCDIHLPRIFDQVQDFVVVVAPDGHTVDFYGVQSDANGFGY